MSEDPNQSAEHADGDCSSMVTPLRRSASLLWAPGIGEVIPVVNEDVLRGLIQNWLSYGQRSKIFAQSESGRESRVVSLGDDGWALYVRDARMQRWGWPAAKLVSTAPEGGGESTVTTSTHWYRPNEESDLAGGMLFAENILVSPTQVASAAWAWMNNQPLPDGLVLDRASFDPIPCATVSEAFARIPVDAFEWPPETRDATIAFAERLGVARAILMNPRSILIQTVGSDRRVRLTLLKDATVMVPGLEDDMGRKYTVSLPSGDIVRRERPRRKTPRAQVAPTDGTVTNLRSNERDADV